MPYWINILSFLISSGIFRDPIPVAIHKIEIDLLLHIRKTEYEFHMLRTFCTQLYFRAIFILKRKTKEHVCILGNSM